MSGIARRKSYEPEEKTLRFRQRLPFLPCDGVGVGKGVSGIRVFFYFFHASGKGGGVGTDVGVLHVGIESVVIRVLEGPVADGLHLSSIFRRPYKKCLQFRTPGAMIAVRTGRRQSHERHVHRSTVFLLLLLLFCPKKVIAFCAAMLPAGAKKNVF